MHTSTSGQGMIPVSPAAVPSVTRLSGGGNSFNLKLDEVLWEYARDGNLEEVRKHVEAGADKEFQANDVYTPCGIAAKYARHDVVKFLLDRGADPFRGKDGFHAVKWYAERGEPDQLAHVLSHAHDPSCVGHILQYLGDDVDTMEALIAVWGKRHDVNGSGTDGHTLLLSYCAHGGVHVHTLVDAGADVNVQCDGGNTALHYAAYHNMRPMAHNLMQYPTRVDIRNEEGYTALEVALYHSEEVPASDHQAWKDVLNPDGVVLNDKRGGLDESAVKLLQQFMDANKRLMDVNRVLATNLSQKDGIIKQLTDANRDLAANTAELVRRVRALEEELARARLGLDDGACRKCARDKNSCDCVSPHTLAI